MAELQCCPTKDLQWTQRVIEEQYADVFFCASCGHVHRTEKYSICPRFPYQSRCVNCGGDLEVVGGNPQAPQPHQVRCRGCGLTAAEDHDLHHRLAALHPSRDFLAASSALVEDGRYVLALKLATAETRWGRSPVDGEIQRLGVLEAMNEYDRALDEAHEWAENEGCPTEIYGVIAQLEAGAQNLRGAIAALEKGLQLQPDNAQWWADYADLMLHQDDRPAALRAGAKALNSAATEKRAMAVIAEVAERLYANGQYAEALGACSLCGEDRQLKNWQLAWLRARIAATNQDTQYLLKWLRTTVELKPDLAEARAMLAPYEKKKGWFNW